MDSATLIGLIFMVVLGPAVGNYACSVVYRLPLGRTPFERHPYCGHCNADLQPKDLFPILSWLGTRGKCRYCRGEIPAIYTVIELACLALFVGYFLAFGIGETFLLLTAFGVFAIILAAIEWQQGWLSSSIYGFAFTFVALFSTLAEGGIYGWVGDWFIMLVLGLVTEKLLSTVRRGAFTPFERPWIWWTPMVVALVPMPLALFPLLLAAFAVASASRYAPPFYVAVALSLPLLLGV